MIATDSVVAIVQAGGEGSRMDVLTRERAKPALPFGGVYRLIDFALSSLTHSRIQDVWVSVQFQAGSLDAHVANGRPWDLDRSRGGFRWITPQTGTGSPQEDGFAQGNADLLLRMRSHLEQSPARTVVVLSADQVFAMDLRPVIQQHLEQEAVATLVTVEVTKTEARHRVMVHTKAGRATAVETKPSRPSSTTALAEIFVYDKQTLLTLVDRLRAERAANGDAEGEDSGLGDFGDHLLPALIDLGPVLTVPVDGYWRDAGRPETYFRAHRELLAGAVDAIGRPDLPILSHRQDHPATRFGPEAAVGGSAIASGCLVDGQVTGSVLGHNVVVEAGAVVRDSILFDDVTVRAGARVSTALVDEGVEIGARAVVGEPVGRRLPTDDDLVLVGRQSVVSAGCALPAGARLEPGTTA